MAFPETQADAARPKRVALYLRVSTGRQAAGDVSIPSQRELTHRYCEARGWVVTEEFVEPGASATDDRRPVFQPMLEQAREPDRRFNVILVHAFSRFSQWRRDGTDDPQPAQARRGSRLRHPAHWR